MSAAPQHANSGEEPKTPLEKKTSWSSLTSTILMNLLETLRTSYSTRNNSILSLNRKLKYTANGGNGTPDWPYYKSIERILSKVPDHCHMSPPDIPTAGPSTSLESSVPQSAPPSGFLPEYTGSSEDRDINDDEEGLTENSASSLETR